MHVCEVQLSAKAARTVGTLVLQVGASPLLQMRLVCAACGGSVRASTAAELRVAVPCFERLGGSGGMLGCARGHVRPTCRPKLAMIALHEPSSDSF